LTLHPRAILRPFTLADMDKTLEHLDQTATATYSENFARFCSENARQPPDPATCLGGPSAKMIIADAGGAIIGSVVYRDGEDDDASFICSMYVSPTWQRQGLGSRLLAAALQDMPADRNVMLYAMKSSVQAINFYEKSGFTIILEHDFEFAGEIFPSFGMILYAPFQTF
jgi:ribosomal protein S18 acetylase RimI-like enzyme